MKFLNPARLYSIIAAVVIFTLGWMLNSWLLESGVYSLALRNLIVMVAGYALFFLVVYLWIIYLRNNPSALKKVAEESKHAFPNKTSERTKKKDIYLDFLNGAAPDSFEAILIIVAVIILAVLIWYAAIWIGYEIPIILVDAAFEVALAAGLVRSATRSGKADWQDGVIKNTLRPFLIILSISTMVYYLAEISCPAHNKLSDVFSQCWLKKHDTSKCP